MDEEMQRDQELLTAALNNEERAYNAYKKKIDKWNAQHKTPEEPLGTSKKISRDKSDREPKEIKDKIENPKKAIDKTKYTQKQTSGATIKRPKNKPAVGKLDK